MIKQITNNIINFKGASPQRKEDSYSYERQRTRKATSHQNNSKKTASQTKTKVLVRNSNGDVFEYNPKIRNIRPANKNKKKKKTSPLAPIALGATILLAAAGLNTCSRQENKPQTDNPPYTIIETSPNILNTDNEIEVTQGEFYADYNTEDITSAVETIKSNQDLKEVFYNLIETKNNMRSVIDNPIETIETLLEQPWAQDVEIELVLPQIFFESSGMHYLKDGSINSSWADCNGFMQLSKAAQGDMNKNHFDDNEQDRNDPLGNLKLGIAYDSELLNKYFDGDIFSAIAAYNCGPTNAKNGTYYGADVYANNILGYYNILKNNPQYTQMLLDGALDEYQDEFIY